MTELEILYEYREYFELNKMIDALLRSLGWAVVRFLIDLADAVQNLVVEVLDFSDVVDSDHVQGLLNTFSGVALGIGILSLAIYGVRYMISDKIQLKSIIDSVLLGIGTMMIGSIIIGNLLTMSVSVARYLHSSSDTESNFAIAFLNSSTVDMYAMFENGFDTSKSHPNFTKETLEFFDPTETLNKDRVKDKVHKNVLDKKIIRNANGQLELDDINKFLWIGIEEHYFRYKIDLFPVFVFLCISIAVILMTAFKFVQLIFEILFNQTLLPLFGFFDLQGARPLIQILKNIWNALLAIVLGALVLRTYANVQSYLSVNKFSDWASILIQLGLGFIVIDGPNIIQKLTGYDAGLKSVGRSVIGLGAAATLGAQKVGKLFEGAAAGARSIRKTSNDSSSSKNENSSLLSSERSHSQDVHSNQSVSANEREQAIDKQMNQQVRTSEQSTQPSGNQQLANQSGRTLQTDTDKGVANNRSMDAGDQAGNRKENTSDFADSLNKGQTLSDQAKQDKTPLSPKDFEMSKGQHQTMGQSQMGNPLPGSVPDPRSEFSAKQSTDSFSSTHERTLGTTVPMPTDSDAPPVDTNSSEGYQPKLQDSIPKSFPEQPTNRDGIL